MRKIVLASASPRRRDILKRIGLKFTVDPSDCDERVPAGAKPREAALLLARTKADSVAAGYDDAIVIAADTVIDFRGRMLGKPHSKRDAKRMLTLLIGNVHAVITGFAIVDTKSGKRAEGVEKTKVRFKKVSAGAIAAYVKSGEPLDKAGGYAIQGAGAFLVEKIEGDFFNVVGLPVGRIAEALKPLGIDILARVERFVKSSAGNLQARGSKR